MTIASNLSDLVKKLPPKPGVYQFFSNSGIIIYVGKAKNLRKRVASYFFQTDSQSYKHHALVSKITDIKYVIVENESEALLLENNLIKEYQPRYNILLKDDKTYPWICIKKERFPRVFSTREYIYDGSEYFGPYTSGIMVKTLLDLIRHLYKLRTCNFVLSEVNISKHKYKKCLEFHLGNCKAPCEDLQLESEYNQSIEQIREILKGNLQQVMSHLRKLMITYSRQMLFEDAEVIKGKILILEKFKSKSTIVNPKINNVDVFGIIDEKDNSYVNFLKVVQGAIVQAHNVEIVKKLNEEKEEVLSSVIFDLRKRFHSFANEVIVPFRPDIGIDKVKLVIPIKGDKLKLLELSMRNALAYKSDKLLAKANERKPEPEEKILLQLKEDLRLQVMPRHIECFDNSNIQGTSPVASCVVFVSGRPQKSLYRHFNIKSVIGPNDFASMEEIIFRRYKRLLDENGNLPELIVIDGGKGQLSAAVKILKLLGIYGQISIIGIAKRLEEIYVPDDPVPLYLNKNSTSLRLIQRIRDEAHRFGITFHRNKRSKSQVDSEFTNIPGIGEITKDKILKFESDINKLREMSEKELSKVIGTKAARALLKHLNEKV